MIKLSSFLSFSFPERIGMICILWYALYKSGSLLLLLFSSFAFHSWAETRHCRVCWICGVLGCNRSLLRLPLTPNPCEEWLSLSIFHAVEKLEMRVQWDWILPPQWLVWSWSRRGNTERARSVNHLGCSSKEIARKVDLGVSARFLSVLCRCLSETMRWNGQSAVWIMFIKTLFNNVFTLKNPSCMSLHAISVFDNVSKLRSEKIAPQKHH